MTVAPTPPRPKRALVRRSDLWLGAAAFTATLALGGAWLLAPWVAARAATNPTIAVTATLALVCGLWMRRWALLRGLRQLADRALVDEPRRLAWCAVIDGDTIDVAGGERLRIANIDAPETGDNAKCVNERRMGEQAAAYAARLLASAHVIEQRSTWRRDRHGRRVAYVLIDGRDLGEAMVAAGYAAPWRGRRKFWCGPDGPLTQMATKRQEPLNCIACRHLPHRPLWRRLLKALQSARRRSAAALRWFRESSRAGR